jgi:hypothetical protein
MIPKERRQRHSLQHWLRANGVQLHMDDEDAGLKMRQTGAEFQSSAFDLNAGGTGYMVNISITITHSEFAIADITLELPWADTGVSLLEDPRQSGAQFDRYSFPGDETLSFERMVVMNHAVNEGRPLRRGQTMEGLLLWFGWKPIPDEFVQGVFVPASLVVFDQLYTSYPLEVDLWIDRSAKGARDKRKRKSRPGLFSQPDSSPVKRDTGRTT